MDKNPDNRSGHLPYMRQFFVGLAENQRMNSEPIDKLKNELEPLNKEQGYSSMMLSLNGKANQLMNDGEFVNAEILNIMNRIQEQQRRQIDNYQLGNNA